MKYVWPFIIKLAMVTAVISMILVGFFTVSLTTSVTISLILSVISFIIGDLYVLPTYKYTRAVIVDFILVIVGISVFGYFLFDPTVPTFMAALLSALFLAVGETFFHIYLSQYLYVEADESRGNQPIHTFDMQTEFGKDMNDDIKPDNTTKKDDGP